MSRYLIKFIKTGPLRFTSHLDLMRLFQRAIKRAEIPLNYSRGFNPHPKISFALPLSLGYTSIGEYMEFETPVYYEESFLIDSLNAALPSGVKVIDCRPFSDSPKTAAALVRWGAYQIGLEEENGFPDEFLLKAYLSQERIMVLKKIMKGRNTAEIDIKPLIGELLLSQNAEGHTVLYAKIRAGSEGNLNPELLLRSLFGFAGTPYPTHAFHINRVDLYKENGLPLNSGL